MANKKGHKRISGNKARFLLQTYLLSKIADKEQSGFSLFELVVVVVVLGILSSFALTSIGNATKFAQLDEAKALLNAAAAECLQRVRTHPDDYQTWQPDALKSREMKGSIQLPGNYQYKDSMNTCAEVSIHDPSDESSLLMDLKFSVIGGKIIKEAVNKNNETESACISWGNCGGSESAEYLKACNKTKDTCNSNLSKVISTGSNADKGYKWVGQCTWPKANPLPTCSDDCWVFEGSCFSEQSDYLAADAASKTQKCNDYEASLRSSNFDGQDLNGTNNECDQNYWWCNGEKMSSKIKYDECKAAENAAGCASEKATWLKQGGDGKMPDSTTYTCASSYKCSGTEVDYSEYMNTCGNACKIEKDAWLAKGVDGKMKWPNSCPSQYYMCSGSEVTEDVYNATCGAVSTKPCCEKSDLEKGYGNSCKKSLSFMQHPGCCGSDKDFWSERCPGP
ncbi:prepilin-type N-terminal cleavage/methylation domain-containing protein [Prochlorococcus marinus]|uniref:prepilin-type N-terminal cleavage/methylation domain-containing protein n=1 Tax=Prochlorococcus TaxID=1218 RepID=UPI0007B3B2A4|nr:prepilin-type N-terminal cleavage/methylation domain-containing protein [Prochlorococcus marinus]